MVKEMSNLSKFEDSKVFWFLMWLALPFIFPISISGLIIFAWALARDFRQIHGE